MLRMVVIEIADHGWEVSAVTIDTQAKQMVSLSDEWVGESYKMAGNEKFVL